MHRLNDADEGLKREGDVIETPYRAFSHIKDVLETHMDVSELLDVKQKNYLKKLFKRVVG